MSMSDASTCIRCGKTRVLEKEWIETIKTFSGETQITHKQFICPDPNCQEEVEAELAAKKKLVIEREKRAQKRAEKRLNPSR